MDIQCYHETNVYKEWSPIFIRWFPFSSGTRILDIFSSWGKHRFYLEFIWHKNKKNKLTDYGN